MGPGVQRWVQGVQGGSRGSRVGPGGPGVQGWVQGVKGSRVGPGIQGWVQRSREGSRDESRVEPS